MKVVTYLRVSTNQQGLGLESQRNICQHFIDVDGHEHIKEFMEKKSAKTIDHRPILQKAIKYCLENNCYLMVAKVDRLSRDIEHTFKIYKQLNKRLLSCDIPQLDTMTLGIYSTLAQRERELISIRTKASLKVLKDKGVKLGNPQNLTTQAIKKGIQANIDKAASNPNNIRAMQLIKELRDNKNLSYREIAQQLNDNQFKTSKGKDFQPTSVMRLYKRA